MSRFVEAAALVRLIETGTIRESKRNLPIIKRFDTAQWLERSTRKAEWCVRKGCGSRLEKRLDELVPSWKEECAFLRSLQLNPYNPDDIRSLPVLRQKRRVPGVVNRRNWKAATGVSPKRTAKLQSESVTTADWIMRMRPNRGFACRLGDREIDLYRDSLIYTECIIPERMWYTLESFTGKLPDVLVSCENLGAYIDLPIPPHTAVAYSPGTDTVAVIELLRKLPSVPWVHFGDLDPAGFRIARTIACAARRDVKIYIPSFAADYLPGASLKEGWDDSQMPESAVVAELIKTRRRMFQEVFMLDPRLAQDLEDFLGGGL